MTSMIYPIYPHMWKPPNPNLNQPTTLPKQPELPHRPRLQMIPPCQLGPGRGRGGFSWSNDILTLDTPSPLPPINSQSLVVYRI